MNEKIKKQVEWLIGELLNRDKISVISVVYDSKKEEARVYADGELIATISEEVSGFRFALSSEQIRELYHKVSNEKKDHEEDLANYPSRKRLGWEKMSKVKPLNLEKIKESIIDELRKENFTTESYPAIHFIVDKAIKEFNQCIQDAKKEFMKELDNTFETMDEEELKRYDVIWFDPLTPLYEEIVIRFERIFGEVEMEERTEGEKK